MSTKAERALDRETTLIRALVAGLDYETIHALQTASLATAATIDALDGQYPNPDARQDAHRLRATAGTLSKALNLARMTA